MKKHFSILLLVCTILGYFSSCTKEMSGDFVTYTNNELNDTTWTKNSTITAFEAAMMPLQTPSVVDTFNANTGASLVYGDSLQISLPSNSYFTIAGAATGTLNVEITILKNRVDFIRFAKPTITANALLDAGVEIDIKITKNGQEVFLQQGAVVKIKLRDVTASGDMKFFTGGIAISNGTAGFLWQQNNDGKVSLWTEMAGALVKKLGYEFTSNRLRWFGGCNVIDSLQPKARLNVVLPVNFTNKNTTVFAVFKNKKTVVALSADNDKRLFYSTGLPIGSEVTLVSLTRINNDFYLGSKVVIVSNANLIAVKPEKKELLKVFEFLSQL